MPHILTEAVDPVSAGASSRQLAQVYRQHVQYVWRSLRHLGVQSSDLEDVCHDVFLVVGRKLPTFEQRSSLRTWIYGICLRTASDYRSRAFRRREVLHDEILDKTYGADQEDRTARHQVRNRLIELLDQLPDEQREVFVLYEIEELPMREVASATGSPLQTAYSRLHAARRELKDKLRARGVSP